MLSYSESGLQLALDMEGQTWGPSSQPVGSALVSRWVARVTSEGTVPSFVCSGGTPHLARAELQRLAVPLGTETAPGMLEGSGTYRLFHVEDGGEYLVYGYADADSSGHRPQSLGASELGNLWIDQRAGYKTETCNVRKAMVKKGARKSLA